MSYQLNTHNTFAGMSVNVSDPEADFTTVAQKNKNNKKKVKPNREAAKPIETPVVVPTVAEPKAAVEEQKEAPKKRSVVFHYEKKIDRNFYTHPRQPRDGEDSNRRFTDRHSGDSKAGVKPTYKRNGTGRNNWGNFKDDLNQSVPSKKEAEPVEEEEAEAVKYRTLEEYKISQGFVPTATEKPKPQRRKGDVTDMFEFGLVPLKKQEYRTRPNA